MVEAFILVGFAVGILVSGYEFLFRYWPADPDKTDEDDESDEPYIWRGHQSL